MSNISQFFGGGAIEIGVPFLAPPRSGLTGDDAVTLKGKTYVPLNKIRTLSGTTYPDLHALLGDGWDEYVSAASGASTNIYHNGTTFFAVADANPPTAKYSADGITWNGTTWTTTFTGSKKHGAAGTLFWASGTASAEFATSTDGGVNLATRTLSGGSVVTDVAYGASIWVAVCQGGTNSIFSSTDGATWTNRSTVANLNFVAFGNGVFVATTSNSRTTYTSANGTSWTTNSNALPDNTAYGYAYALWFNGTHFVCQLSTNTPEGGRFYATSTDGVTWTVVFGNGSAGTASWSTTSRPCPVFSYDGRFWRAQAASLYVSDNCYDWETITIPTHGSGIEAAIAEARIVGPAGYCDRVVGSVVLRPNTGYWMRIK